MTSQYTAPEWAFPRQNTRVYKMLMLFMSGRVIQETELCNLFGHNYRSAIQILEGERYLWRIENELKNGVISGRKLDPRHLSGNPLLDALARLERAVELKLKSANQAFREKRRAAIAKAELDFAMERLEAFKAENENAPEVTPESV